VTVAVIGSLTGACTDAAPDPLGAVAGRVPRSVGGWVATGEDRRFDRESIFSYLDGHAEVYLAYGMQGCLARRYQGPVGEPDLVLDLFWMASSADAYGVFTWDQDGDPVAVGQGGLLRPSWLSAWQGRCFLSLYAEGETPAAAGAMAELAAGVAGAVGEEGSRPALVDSLPRAGLEPRSLRFVRSRQALAIQLGVAPAVAPAVELGSGIVLAHYRRDGGEARMLLWAEEDAAAAERAEVGLRAWLEAQGGARATAVRRQGSLVAVVLEASSPQLALDLSSEATKGGG